MNSLTPNPNGLNSKKKHQSKISYPFIPLPKAIVLDPRLDRGDLAVLVSLYSFMDSKTRVCFPKISTIAKRARASPRFTRSHIHKLEKYGYIKILKLGGGKFASTYYLSDKDPSEFESKAELFHNHLLNPEVGDLEYHYPLSSQVTTPLPSQIPTPLYSEGRHNKNHLTKINEQHSTKEEESLILKIFDICNSYREQRFNLPSLKPDTESIKVLKLASEQLSSEELLLIAESYFKEASGDYMKITNAFREDKLHMKLQIAIDKRHLKDNPNKDSLNSISNFLSIK